MKGSDHNGPGDLRAAALSYSGEGAPVLVAKGDGLIAERIRDIARENDVPLVQDEQLTGLLCQIPLGDEIPPDLYVAVAEVLAYVYRLNDTLSRRV